MKNKLRAVLEYVLASCIILEFNTPYLIFPTVKRGVQLVSLFLLLALVLMSGYSPRKKVNGYVAIYLAGSVFPLLVLEPRFYLGYAKIFIFMLPLMWTYLSLRKSAGNPACVSLFLRFSDVTVVLAVVSLAMWVSCSVLQAVPATAMFPYRWAPDKGFVPTYYGIYFETQQVGDTWRNTGMFCEGPMYNMVLCAALSMECFIRPVKSKARIFILSVTVLSTLTTTGQLFLLALGGWHLVRFLGGKLRLILVVAIPFLLYAYSLAAGSLMDYKKETGGEYSVDNRSRDIELCLNIGLEHPLLGIGMFTEKNSQVWRGYYAGFSNSLFTVFMRGGVYMLALYAGALVFIPLLYYRRHKDAGWLVAMLCYFSVFSITVSYLGYLTLLFIAWGLSNMDMARWRRTRHAG